MGQSTEPGHREMRKRLFIIALLMLALVVLAPTVALAKTKTKLSATLSSSVERRDYTPTITGQLRPSRGKVIKKARLYLYRDGVRVASAKTNSKGRVTFVANTADDATSATWGIRFAGDRKYKSSKSPTRQTDCDVLFNGLARYDDIDVDGDFTFTVPTNMEAGRTYVMYFSHPVAVLIGYPDWGTVLDGCAGVPVTQFTFTAPTYSPYEIFLYTNPTWGGTETLDVFIW
jgi:hypothetical protein